MVWRLPPARAGRAPHASRHSNTAELVAARLALVVDVVAELGAEGGVLIKQALAMDATQTLPASPSS